MRKEREMLLEKKMIRIKKVMKDYHNAFDRSLRFRRFMESFKDDRHEYRLYFEKMTDAEIRCIELDEALSKLISEYQLLKLQ